MKPPSLYAVSMPSPPSSLAISLESEFKEL